MIPNRIELMMRRRNTSAFIRADPTEIVIHRREKIVLNGGWKWGPEITLSPQMVRIIPAKRRYGDATTNTEAGQVVNWPYIVDGFYDLNIERGDWFEHGGEKFEVKSVEQDRDEKTMAFIDYFGNGS